MANTNRMAEEGRKLGEQVVEQAKRVGQATEDQMTRGSEQFQDAARIGIDAANNSFLEVTRLLSEVGRRCDAGLAAAA